jgi:hypothetical protein
MPRKPLIVLSHFLAWLSQIRNDLYLDEGVSVEYIQHRYNQEHSTSVKVREISAYMTKATHILPYISMKSKRRRQESKHTRYFYFIPSRAPTDTPTTTPPRTHTKPRTITPEQAQDNTTNPAFDKANDPKLSQDPIYNMETDLAETPLTLLSRAAQCLEQMDPLVDTTTSSMASPNMSSTTSPTKLHSPLDKQSNLEINTITDNTIEMSHTTLSSTSTNSFSPLAQSYINKSTSLCFSTYPRPDPRFIPSNKSIPGTIDHIHCPVRLPSEMKIYMLMVGKQLGFDSLSTANRKILISAILTTESYLEGYAIPMGSVRSFMRWNEELKKKELGVETKQSVRDMFRDKSGNHKIPYSKRIQDLYPTLLHSLFRYAGNTHGFDANTSILISSMNKKSKALYPNCEIRSNLSLSKYTFTRFFNENKGKVREAKTKPRLSEQNKAKRVVFCKKNKKRLNRKKKKNTKFHYCFIDEKWFYVYTNRKKNKYLPAAPFENLSDVFVPARKVRSKRHVTKVMFMGIVAPPDYLHDFDGKIMMKRVSREETTKKTTHHQRFSDSYHINQLLKEGEWKKTCFMPGMETWQLFDAVQQTYDLDDDVLFSLVLSYHHYNSDKTKTKTVVRLNRESKDVINLIDIRTKHGGPLRKIHLDDLTLHVRVERGSKREADVNCDTSFMLDTIDEIGSSIRSKMWWVPKTDPIYLFIDNAGGHGTNEGKDKYEKILKDKFNIILEWQVPNSPETNMLDLGAWMTIQSVVEELHRQRLMNENALADTVMQAFADFDGKTKLAAIAARWELVLDLILEDNGGNDLVETKRGTLTKTLLGKRLPISDVHNQERKPLEVEDSDDDDNETTTTRL